MEIEAGQQLLQYRLITKIGEGGMGTVWKAVDTDLGREVAIKFLPPAFADDVDRLARGALPVEDALDMARQVCRAFEAAHDAGVIHRDLKPANVVLPPDGTIRVLDLLFEMLTGRAAFGGETVTDTLAAVVRAEPDWETLPAETPLAIRRLLRRCLAKDPSRRLRDAGDVHLEIDDALADLGSPDGAGLEFVDAPPVARRGGADAHLDLLARHLAGRATYRVDRDRRSPPDDLAA